MRVIIFEHNDPDGPEEVELPEEQTPPPVRIGVAPHFRIDEGYWIVPVALASSRMLSRKTKAGMALDVLPEGEVDWTRARTYSALLGPRVDRKRLKSTPRALRGKKMLG